MGDGDGAGLLRIVHEVALGEVVGSLADDLDGVLIGAHGAIGAETVEQRAHGGGIFGVELGIVVQAGMGDIVLDADGEVVLGRGFLQFVEDALDHGGCEFLGGQAVAAADDLAGLVAHFHQRRDHVAVERLADGAGLLGAVQNRERFRGSRQRGMEGFDGERAVQADLEEAYLLAGGVEGVHGFVGHFGAGTHHNEDALGVRGANVIEQMVMPAHNGAELVHGVLDDGGRSEVERVHRFARLEIDIGILSGAAEDGPVRT